MREIKEFQHIKVGEWYWNKLGGHILFFKCSQILVSDRMKIYTNFFISSKHTVVKTDTDHYPAFSSNDIDFLDRIEITDILNYNLDGELPPLWA